MIIKCDNFIITDNSKDAKNGVYFLKDNSNAKYENDALSKGAIIIDEIKARELLGINEDIKIIAITGTNGKTTTAAAIYSMLLDLGEKAFLCGTRGAFCNDEKVGDKNLTTPFLLEFLHYLKIATQNDCKYFVMEVSSHAIDQQRLGKQTKFSAKIYTNLTQDHLDYHKSFENYAKTKESFFADDCLKIINNDAYKINYNYKNSITYGIDNPSFYSVKAYSLNDGIDAVVSFSKNTFHIKSELVGLFNLYNLLSAFACINELVKPDLEKLEIAMESFGGVKGRMQVIVKNVIVDFAHTPDGIQKVCDSLKHKKLIVVVGAGGNRDKTKRPLMAQIAKHYAKTLILTSDNPRDEEPKDIINDMLSGLDDKNGVEVIEDRFMAIKRALELQKDDEMVLVLGKGDEDYQEIKGVKHHFSDEETILKLTKGE